MKKATRIIAFSLTLICCCVLASVITTNLVNKKSDGTPSVVISTASPYKFVSNVLKAIGYDTAGVDDLDMADILCKMSKVPIPDAIDQIRNAKILHDTVCAVEDMEETVIDFLS